MATLYEPGQLLLRSQWLALGRCRFHLQLRAWRPSEVLIKCSILSTCCLPSVSPAVAGGDWDWIGQEHGGSGGGQWWSEVMKWLCRSLSSAALAQTAAFVPVRRCGSSPLMLLRLTVVLTVQEGIISHCHLFGDRLMLGRSLSWRCDVNTESAP